MKIEKFLRLILIPFLTVKFLTIFSMLYAVGTLSMPKGLEKVFLGMGVHDLKAIKPNVKKDDFPYSPLYFETDLSNEFFHFVSYEFSKDRLVEITLSKSSEKQDFISGLVRGATKKWGSQYLRKIGIIVNHPITRKTQLYPVIIWKKQEATIVLSIIIATIDGHAMHDYQITIMDPSLSPENAPRIKFKENATQMEIEDLFNQYVTQDNPHSQVFD